MLILRHSAATGSAHYFFFFRRAAKSDPSSLPSLSASSFFCLGDIFFADFFAVFLQVPLHPGFPHFLHIVCLSRRRFGFLAQKHASWRIPGIVDH
jgi:hypothetical protein